MAKSGVLNSSGYEGRYLQFSWTARDPDIANNQTTIDWTLKGAGEGQAGYYTSGPITLNIAGEKVYYSETRFRLYDGTVVASGTRTLTHNNDGTRQFTVDIVAAIYTFAVNCTGSGSFTLDSIERASEISVNTTSVKMGNPVTISINRKHSALTHTLIYSFGGARGTIATGVGTSYQWNVPDLAAKISNATSGKCTITCQTYSGSTLIGSQSVDIELSVPDASAPTVSARTVQMGTSLIVYTNRKSSAFTHEITYKIGDKTDTISGSVSDSVSWTPHKDLAKYTGNKKNATCTITCNTKNGTALVGTNTVSLTLEVPLATSLTLSTESVEIGKPITIGTPRETDAYTHDLTYTIAGVTGTIATNVGTEYQWTVPAELAKKFTETSAMVTVTCTTRFNGSTSVVGTSSETFKVTVPNNESTQPKVNSLTMECVSDLPSKFAGIYVVGKTKVKVTYDATSDLSTIDSYSTTVQGVTGGGNPYTSALLSSAGQVTISGKVTDKRGYSTTVTDTISVEPYSRPRILPGQGKNSIICTRCKSDGTPDAGGTYLLIQIGRKYSPVGNKNTCKLSYRHKTDAATDYSSTVELLAAGASSNYVSKVLSNIVSSNTTAYTIQLIAEDDLGEKETVTITIPTAFTTVHAPEGGHGLTVGGYHDPSKYDVFDCIFDAEFEGDVSGKVIGLGKLPEISASTDLNDCKDFGVWSVPGGLKNSPSTLHGTLRVWSANGSGDASGYIIQEYITSDNYCSYRRSMYLSNGSWVYGPWNVTSGCDAIVEQGQTNGWTWRKFANGIAECWRRVSQIVDITNSKGMMYYGVCQDVTYPFTFAEVPVCHTSVECRNILLIGSFGIAVTTKPSQICVFKPQDANPEEELTVVYHAIGRWK